MPSTGNTPRQRWPSCENPTRRFGEGGALAWAGAGPRAARDPLERRVVVRDVEGDDRPSAIDADAAHDDRRRAVVDLERRAVELARQGGGRRGGRRVRGAG